MKLTSFLIGSLVLAPLTALAQLVAPGQPGSIGTWSHPEKQAYGTSRTRPVWFTIVRGALSEVTYPTVELVQTRDSFLVIRDAQGGIFDERACRHDIRRLPRTLIYDVKSTCPGAVITKRFVASPTFDGIEIEYSVQFDKPLARQLVFVHNPTGAATAGGDGLQVMKDPNGEPILIGGQVDLRGDEPSSLHGNAVQAVTWNLPQSFGTVGFEGVSSPMDLMRFNNEIPQYSQALYGNVAGALVHKTDKQTLSFHVAIAFSENRIQNYSHVRGRIFQNQFADLVRTHTTEWSSYLSRLKYDNRDPLSESSILVLKALEDKSNPGALIAGPANPAIPWLEEAHEQNYEDSRVRRGDSNSGYRRVWPRDLYHKAMAFMSVGDNDTAMNTLRWFRKTQLRDGTWSQNMWVDGTPSWQAFQIDETALPVMLVWRLVEAGRVSYPEYRNMVRAAAIAVARRGPGTGQERWEENGGLSPNSFAAAVQGLRAASWLEALPGGDARYAEMFKAKADEWTSNLKNWLVIPQGAFGSNYIARLELGRNGQWDPTHHDNITIANKANGQRKVFREDEILDGGFIEWIIAGLIDPHDREFTNTLQIYDRSVRKQTRAGLGYRRYTEDAFGGGNVGGAWPLLSAERAIAAIERGEGRDVAGHLAFIRGLATPADMICEQDTIATCPLGWSHGAYLILRRSIAEGRSFYIPRSEIKKQLSGRFGR